MTRLVFGLLLALVSLPATSVLSLNEICVEGCPDDQSSGECAPGCDDCACCHAVRAMAPVSSGIAAPTSPARSSAPPSSAAPPAVDPHEIFHVPRSAAFASS